jgi:pyridoxal phosphate enzyme (YggS family)
METIAMRLAAVQARIANAAHRAGRRPEEITLVGVSKTHPPESIAEALAAGLAHFGENRVQEAEGKIAMLADVRARSTWHLIGHLQRNKARKAATLFDIIHSVDSLRLAAALDREQGARSGDYGRMNEASSAASRPASPGSRLPILLQVNVSGEATKEGFALADWESRPAVLEAFQADAAALLALPNLRVAGLMTIAPWADDPEAARPTFRAVRRLRDRLAQDFPQADWSTLSMGMTDDFAVAIEEGATLVRIGRAIFGARE